MKKKRVFLEHDRKYRRMKLRASESEEQAYAKIWKLFLIKMIRRCPQATTGEDWLDFLFGVEFRSVKTVEVIEDFLLPGSEVHTVLRVTKPAAPPLVRKGNLMVVRHDTREPDRVEISCNVGKGAKEAWFRLTELEWKGIKKHVRER